jgi:carbon monoxide dehydrogenase subunit G
MELTNEFSVGVPPSQAWKVLTDLERIAPMLPGAQLQEVEGEEYRGTVKIKVGPITAQYRGSATFLEKDEQAGRVVLKATGRDTKGQGNASAVITATMSPDGEGTKVVVDTDLTVTGKVAQFGRGVLAEVSAKLIGQFVDALEADLAGGGQVEGAGVGPEEAGTSPEEAGTSPEEVGASPEEPAPNSEQASGAPAAGEAAPKAPSVRKIDSPEPEPLDLLSVAGGSTIRRLAPVAGVLVALVILLARRRARRLAVEASRSGS